MGLLLFGRMASHPKSTSNRRLAANRANAQKSTGPKTTAGKAKSSLNAVKTGLTGRTVLLPSDDVAAYKKHLRHFAEHFQPVGALETLLVQAMADTQWRLDRLPRLESGILALGRRRCDPDLFADEPDPAVREVLLEAHVYEAEAKALKNLSLQASRLRRHYQQDLQELLRLQGERAQIRQKEENRRAWEQEKRSIFACGCEQCQNLARHLTPPPPEDADPDAEDGFEFANEEEDDEEVIQLTLNDEGEDN